MTESSYFRILVFAWFALPFALFPLLLLVPAPYGRHARSGWGPTLRSRWAWMVMEAPAALIFAGCFLSGGGGDSIVLYAFLVLWEAHYLHRAFLYPLGLGNTARPIPVVVMVLGFLFNLCNAYLNGRYLFTFSGGYPDGWLGSGRFLGGAALFITGFLINRWADQILRQLRTSGNSAYKVPQGGLYQWISCPNYLGEIMEWTGWAIATRSLPALAFALWTAANLIPRAKAHQIWYRTHFPDYPAGRKALLPGVW